MMNKEIHSIKWLFRQKNTDSRNNFRRIFAIVVVVCIPNGKQVVS